MSWQDSVLRLDTKLEYLRDGGKGIGGIERLVPPLVPNWSSRCSGRAKQKPSGGSA